MVLSCIVCILLSVYYIARATIKKGVQLLKKGISMAYKKLCIVLVASMFLGNMSAVHELSATKKQQKTVEEVIKSRFEQAKKYQDLTSTLLLLSIIVDDAVAQGTRAPDYNLCELPMMCRDNKGIGRIDMPQLGGIPIPGSPADQLKKDKNGEVDAKEEFAKYLIDDLGYQVVEEKVPVAMLKATQNELVGSKVAGIWLAIQDPNSSAAREINDSYIFISNDNYILDGHHRWAAVLGDAMRKGQLKDTTMQVKRINATIQDLIPIATKWAENFGIQVKKGV